MTPAEHVIEKCGGVAATARLVGRTEAAVYKWTYPKNRGGTGGAVPAKAQAILLGFAALGKIDVKPDDFFPTIKRSFVTESDAA